MAHTPDYTRNISKSDLSIYDPVAVGDPQLWIPTPDLETILTAQLRGTSLAGLPLRSRSKDVKEHVCRALGYPVPDAFQKTQPRFPGQMFDTYVQKSHNLQIWNEALVPPRRYVIIKIGTTDTITAVRVVTGEELALLDTTGTLTQKYQARLAPAKATEELISAHDTDRLSPHTALGLQPQAVPATTAPASGQIVPIAEVFAQLCGVLGQALPVTGQQRSQGAALHQLVCERLGYTDCPDDGRFPDIRHQLLEIKLQTSETIDLGLVCPDSTEPLDVPHLDGTQVRHCDVRYVLFAARADGDVLILTHLYLATGANFFSRFPQMQGKTLNKKLQIPLPADFFDR